MADRVDEAAGDDLANRQARPAPRATYRLQFNRDFGFDQAGALAPYLAELGVSHVYCSPYLRARPGSPHGYDIIRHNELNPDLGDRAAFDRMVAAFRRHGLKQILDFVPNHMGIGGADNPWWLDVLEWGRDSEFSGWFDIDWEPDQRYLAGKVLAPFLGEQYGATLESGALRLKFDAETGAFALWAYDNHKLPICPLHYGLILGDAHPALERLADAFSHLSTREPHIANRAKDLKAKLADALASDEAVTDALAERLARFDGVPGELESWSRLDELIRVQYWRLAQFRVAADDINYTRFFDVNELARIRMETPELFAHAHGLIYELLDGDVLDGLRIDHIDGLQNPKEYCLRLRGGAARPFYLVVEKILARHEELPEAWSVDGATGYEVAALITGLLLDPAGEERLTRFYTEFTGSRQAFADIARECKMRIMSNELASELNSISRDMAVIARSNPRTADFTQNVLHRALKEIIAAFPVYRTYIDEEAAPTAADRRDIDWAVSTARRRDDAIDASVFTFLHDLLTCDLIAKPRSGFSRSAVVRAAMRFQRYTGPVMAKGLEDTAFYRYYRMQALNEVGGYPAEFHLNASAFHRANQRRAQKFPRAMLSTSTHDSKRGEDTRARLALLSERADEWTQAVTTWSRILRAGNAGSGMETPPDHNDEYAIYQLILGAWPPELIDSLDPAGVDAFRVRLEGAMLKSMREAKVNTTWAQPNAAYEDGVMAFIRSALDVSRKNAFLESFQAFLARIAAAGARNSLVQTVLKLTLPGVPDIYQGAELWDFNFVDPDNRRPVDYETRAKTLREISDTGPIEALLTNWRDGRVKLSVVSSLLKLRARSESLFRDGGYEPLVAEDCEEDRIFAFSRVFENETIVIATLLYSGHDGLRGVEHASIPLPAASQGKCWKDILTGRTLRGSESGASSEELFAQLPAVVLVHVDPADSLL